MKKIILSIGILLITFGCGSKKTAVAGLDKDGNLVGTVSKEHFLAEPYSEWFHFNYENYELNSKTIEKLNPIINTVKIKAFMGTWCGDSREQIPVFYKLLDKTNFNYKNLKLIAVNRSKKTEDNLQEGFNIIRVPTFIFLKNGKEIGRFVEYPQESLEEDFLKIISEVTYKHSYQE